MSSPEKIAIYIYAEKFLFGDGINVITVQNENYLFCLAKPIQAVVCFSLF